MALRAASAAPFAADAALRAAAPDFCTSSLAAVASAAAFSAASFAFSAAVWARAEASTARFVCCSARLPSRTTTATSSSIVADSWSRARAMCCPVSMNHSTSDAVPLRARSAYLRTSGPACSSMVVTWDRASSRRALYWVSVRNVIRVGWVSAFRAAVPSRWTALSPVPDTMVVATRRSSRMAGLKPSFRKAAMAASPLSRAATASRRRPLPARSRLLMMATRLSCTVWYGSVSARKVWISLSEPNRAVAAAALTPLPPDIQALTTFARSVSGSGTGSGAVPSAAAATGGGAPRAWTLRRWRRRAHQARGAGSRKLSA